MQLLTFVLIVGLLWLQYSQADEEEDENSELDVVMQSPISINKVVTASGVAEIGKKLGNVTLEPLKNLPTQIWTIIPLSVSIEKLEKSVSFVEMIPKQNEQNTITSYLYNGAHSHNQWKVFTFPTDEGNRFQFLNERNSRCLNDKNGKLYYSKCDKKAKSQLWILKAA